MPKSYKIVLGADHAGYELKEILKKELSKMGAVINDFSPTYIAGDDYPPVAKQVAHLIANDPTQLGILICGTGLGMDIAANRIRGARAVVVRDTKDAVLSREHNHANILILGGRITPPSKAKAVLRAWLQATPSKAARHLRRIDQLDASSTNA